MPSNKRDKNLNNAKKQRVKGKAGVVSRQHKMLMGLKTGKIII
jgi:hypothetical protein